jgi:hypothetical protein
LAEIDAGLVIGDNQINPWRMQVGKKLAVMIAVVVALVVGVLIWSQVKMRPFSSNDIYARGASRSGTLPRAEAIKARPSKAELDADKQARDEQDRKIRKKLTMHQRAGRCARARS